MGMMKMSDFVSKQTVIERMKSMAGCGTCDNYNYVRCRACTWDDAMNIVEEMEPVVVKCRDCKYGHIVNGEMTCTKYDIGDKSWPLELDWYCAGGERK